MSALRMACSKSAFAVAATCCIARVVAADVRRPVTLSPLMIATGAPVSASRTVMTEWTAPRPRAALAGLTLPNLLTAGASGAILEE